MKRYQPSSVQGIETKHLFHVFFSSDVLARREKANGTLNMKIMILGWHSASNMCYIVATNSIVVILLYILLLNSWDCLRMCWLCIIGGSCASHTDQVQVLFIEYITDMPDTWHSVPHSMSLASQLPESNTQHNKTNNSLVGVSIFLDIVAFTCLCSMHNSRAKGDSFDLSNGIFVQHDCARVHICKFICKRKLDITKMKLDEISLRPLLFPIFLHFIHANIISRFFEHLLAN